jgi:hypothetical protein
VTVRGTLGSAAAGYKVLLVGQRGQATVAVANSKGAFKIVASKTVARGASLQLVDSKNRYAGPVVIAKEKVAGAWCAKTKLAGRSVNLGTMTLSKKGFAITKKAPNAATYSKLAVLARTSSGNPLSAGTGGVVKISTAQKKKCTRSKVGSSSVSAMAEASDLLGADKDSDGLPNALDADDDGDLRIDATDPSTTVSAAMNPWVSVRSTNPLFNAALNQGLTPADINATLGVSGNYLVQFFIGQRNLIGDNADPNGVQYAWVDCGELVYCGGTAPTARNNATHLANNNDGVPWKSYSGGFAVEYPSNPPSATFTATGVNPDTAIGNALWLMNRNSQDPEQVYWRASMNPNQAADTLSTVKPGDVFTVRFRTSSGADQQVVMMLNPHAVTVPGITSVNGAAYAGGSLTADATGKLALRFFRPQRLATTGEAGTYRDMAGLRYGLIVMSSRDTPCETGAYSAYDEGFTATTSTDMADRLWPLNDKTVTDAETSASGAQLGFTVDMRACIGAATYDAASSGTTWNVQLVAAGQSLTGGSNRAALEVRIAKP